MAYVAIAFSYLTPLDVDEIGEKGQEYQRIQQ
jgi:hypothetical protein